MEQKSAPVSFRSIIEEFNYNSIRQSKDGITVVDGKDKFFVGGCCCHSMTYMSKNIAPCVHLPQDFSLYGSNQ